MLKKRTGLLMGVVAVACWAAVGLGRPVAVSTEVAVGDAVASVEAWIAAHPKDGAGYRALGRVHALAWAYGEKIPLVGAGGKDALPFFSEFSTVLVSRTGPGEMISFAGGIRGTEARLERPVTAEEARHLGAAVAAYRKAMELDSLDALSELGLGWMLVQEGMYARELPADFFGGAKVTEAEKRAWEEAIGKLADEDAKVREGASKALLAAMPGCVTVLRGAKADDPEREARVKGILRGYFELEALGHYRRAFDLRAKADLAGEPNYDTNSQVSAMAGEQILAVLGRQPEAARKGEVKAVQEVLEPLAKKKERLMMMAQ
jgi:hypothetical protein